MAKYIKKPIAIEAIEYSYGLEDGFDDIEEVANLGLNVDNYANHYNSSKVPFIQTLEGKHYISNDDYIITGVDGERYPCKKSIFLKTYTLINN